MLTYNMPVKLFFGKNVISKNAAEFSKFGKEAFVVTGRNSAKKSGALEEVIAALKLNYINYTIFDRIPENPDIDTIYEAVKRFKENNCDFIIGIGGGSPIDAAKAISVITKNNLKGTEFYNPERLKVAYKLIAVPTTSGTGTEVTQYSVITAGDVKNGFGSPLIFPEVSFADPQYTYSLPLINTRDTAIDALSHLLEGLYSTRRNKLNYPLIHKGIKLILDNLRPCLENPGNYEYRENLMQAAIYGGIVIAQAGTTAQHGIGYALTTQFGVSHGLANGIVMKQMILKNYDYIKNELDDLFEYLDISMNEFFVWLNSFEMSLGFTPDSKFINKYAPEVLKAKNIKINPYPISVEEIKDIYRSLS
jgi:alcohol dehydrogenase